jgi:hypothetical protein
VPKKRRDRFASLPVDKGERCAELFVENQGIPGSIYHWSGDFFLLFPSISSGNKPEENT